MGVRKFLRLRFNATSGKLVSQPETGPLTLYRTSASGFLWPLRSTLRGMPPNHTVGIPNDCGQSRSVYVNHAAFEARNPELKKLVYIH